MSSVTLSDAVLISTLYSLGVPGLQRVSLLTAMSPCARPEPSVFKVSVLPSSGMLTRTDSPSAASESATLAWIRSARCLSSWTNQSFT